MIHAVLGFRRTHAAAPGAGPRAPCSTRPRRAMTGVSSSHFDAIASRVRRVAPGPRGRALPAQADGLRARALPRAGEALDVGCGTGTLAARLAATRATTMAGIDPSEGMLDVLRDANAGRGGGTGAGHRHPRSRTTSFDLVLSVAVMHHIADAAEVRRHARGDGARRRGPRGGSSCWDHNPRNPYWRLLMARVPQDTGEERLIPEDELLDGLAAAGARPLLVDSARPGARLRAASRALRAAAARGAGCGAHTARPPAVRPQRHPCRAAGSSYTLTTRLSSPG